METNNCSKWKEAYSKVVAKAWADENYRNKLLNFPREAFSEMGADVPPSIELSVVQNSDNKMHVVLPVKPSNNEVSEELLESVAAGFTPPPPY